MALSQLYHYYLSIIYTYYYYKLQLYVKKKRIYVTVEQINEKVKWSAPTLLAMHMSAHAYDDIDDATWAQSWR